MGTRQFVFLSDSPERTFAEGTEKMLERVRQKNLLREQQTREDDLRKQLLKQAITEKIVGGLAGGDIQFKPGADMSSLGLDEQTTSVLGQIEKPKSPFIGGGGTPSLPEGFEITKFDASGNPTIEKVKPDVNLLKFNADQEEKEQAKTAQTQMVKDAAQDTLGTIGEIEKSIPYFGAMGALPPWPNEYAKKNWRANLDKLTSKLVVDLMNQMKQASRTGATGFGTLSEKELKLLQDAATALKTTLSEEDAQRYLNQIKEKATKILQGGERFTGKARNNQAMSFGSEEEAMAANLPAGSVVVINGREAIID